MKKRYNKLVAYLLMNFSTCGVGFTLFGLIAFIGGLITGKADTSDIGSFVVYFLLVDGICILLTFLLTLYINSRTPKGERIGTWFRAWWLGFKIAWKIALCCTLILIPAMLKWSIQISENDSIEESNPHWYDERGRVYDDNGHEYKVGRSGEYVQDKNGDWQRVNRDGDGDPYIGSGNDRTWLK